MITIEQMAKDMGAMKSLVEVACGGERISYQELLNFYGFYETLKANDEYKAKLEEGMDTYKPNEEEDEEDDRPIRLV